MHKKCEIIYFSGTGNTAYAAGALSARLIAKDWVCEITDIAAFWRGCGLTAATPPDTRAAAAKLARLLETTELLVIAFPVYASDMPPQIKQLIELLPPTRKTRLAVLCTCFEAGGDACALPAEMLKDKGYRAVFAGYVKMPNNFRVPPLDMHPIKNGAELADYYQTSAAALDAAAAAIEAGRCALAGRTLPARLLGKVQRLMVKMFFKHLTRRFFVNAACTHCGLCADGCPQANITMQNGYPVFDGRCCLCMRCYNFCPVCAIDFTQKTRNAARYPRYRGFDGWTPPRYENKNQ